MLDGVHAPNEAHLRSALEETHVLAQLIEDLRTLSLAEAGALRLREVVANLVVNALRYAPRDSAVTIAATLGQVGRVEVTVEDRGPGIPPEVLPRMFQRFSRGDESGGSGLGLAIVRALVEAHGGTCVRFDLPIEQG
ncbi:MAG: ATP-binding protein [Dehalococcoidia bacterium]|nr:ATP-binding protein [Dehalococcoidia bacterium]